jgi:predicted PurR-regulated permease PerM
MPSTPSPSPDPPASAVAASAAGSSRSPGADRSWPLPRGLQVLLTAAGAVVTVAGLRATSGIVGPAFLALVIVVTIYPLLAWQRHRVPSWLAVAATAGRGAGLVRGATRQYVVVSTVFGLIVALVDVAAL